MNNLDLASKGAGITGAAAGAAIALAGGPVSSILGATIASLSTDLFKDLLSRGQSNRERARLDSAAAHISKGIEYGLHYGRQIRQDGFLGPSPSCGAVELMEGVLLKCKAQYEEKKMQYIANIYLNTLFEPISPTEKPIPTPMAYQTLHFAESITYQNLCIISFFGRREEFSTVDLLNSYFHSYTPEVLGDETVSVARDLLYLLQQGILAQGGSVFVEPTAIVPAKVTLAPRGIQIFRLLGLQSVLTYDVELAVKPLEYQATWGLDSEGKVNGRPVANA
jgi:hypothetical protein